MEKSKTKFKRGKLRRRREEEALAKGLQQKRLTTATDLQASLMKLAMPAIGFKKRLLNNESAPDFLRLKNADDILDRTLAKPTQKVDLNGQILQANLSPREIKELIMKKLESREMMNE